MRSGNCLVVFHNPFFPFQPLFKLTKISLKFTCTPALRALIGDFRVPFCLRVRTSLSAKPFIWKWVPLTRLFTHFHKKSLALRLVLKQRYKGTRKWPINVWRLVFRDFAARSLREKKKEQIKIHYRPLVSLYGDKKGSILDQENLKKRQKIIRVGNQTKTRKTRV